MYPGFLPHPTLRFFRGKEDELERRAAEKTRLLEERPGFSQHGHGLHNLWGAFLGWRCHPFATNFDVHQGCRVLTHRHMPQGVKIYSSNLPAFAGKTKRPENLQTRTGLAP